MLNRNAENLVHELAKQFPIVLILGPRQCGKTTLAKYFLEGEYFDFEKPSDQEIFVDNIEFALKRFGAPLILDEAQILPEIFPVLRSIVDLKRQENGQYFLLGSVNPELVKRISESLAGRVGIIELTPFLYSELAAIKKIDISHYWLKGGYPDAVKEKDPLKWQRWQENYVRTFVERDIPRYGLKATPVQMRRLMGMIAHLHGGLLNASEIGRSLSANYHTISNHLDLIEGHFLIRRLQPYHTNVKKRLIKSPKIYIRDTGMLHYLLGISSERNLLESPKRGNSWEGLMIEQLIAHETLARSGSRFFFYRTQRGAEIDLIVDRGNERLGYEFKCSLSVGKKDWKNLKTGLEEGIIHKGTVVYMGERNYPVADDIEVVNAENLLMTNGPMNK
ncbi:MAG: ATP-binding protein [Deltaproteobacteria bacterium]|nr:ATP-binding protein [Deltaproteobacteria bacterium]